MERRLLSPEQIQFLKTIVDGPYSVQEMAEDFGISESHAVNLNALLQHRGLAEDVTGTDLVRITDDGRLVLWMLDQLRSVLDGRKCFVRDMVDGEVPCPVCGKRVRWTYTATMEYPNGGPREIAAFDLKGARLW